MQRALTIVVLAACTHHAPPPVEAAPAACGHGHGDYSFEDDPIQGELVPGTPPQKPDDAFDAVAFLDGCFGTWHIDAGWDVCFSRTEDGLVGIDTFHSVYDPTFGEHGALLITDLGGVLHVESSDSELGDHLSADAVRIAPREIAFGTDGNEELALRRPDDQGSLFATVASGHTIELKPKRR
ncbi:MAG TPA: hypothetical protein VGM90_06945 [Kofleriaceae bacterium]|jgi:hypothetical protein